MRNRHRTHQRSNTFDLAAIPLLAGIDPADLDTILNRSTPVRLPPRRTLGHEGTAGFDCVLICTGTVEVSQGGRVITELGPGSVFGEMALLGDAPHRRNADGVTTSDCDVLVFTRSEFADLLRRHPVVADRIRAEIAARECQPAPVR